MAEQPSAGRRARILRWAAWVVLASLVALPIVAGQADDSEFSDLGGNYTIPAGKTHHGKLRLFKGTVTIAGTQDGDLWVFGGTLEIPGEVTGDVSFIGSNVKVTGKVGGAVEAKGANCTIAGTVGGNIDAKCGTVELPAGARVSGDAELYAGQITVNGAIDGDLEAEGGQIALAGTVGKDARLRADLVKIDSAAKIAGNLSYESRVPLSLDGKNIVGGSIDKEHKAHVRVHVDDHRSFTGSFFLWLGRLLLSLLVGLAALALARKPGEAVLTATRGDTLRNVGVGFLTFIVVPVAALVSCILIVTIPLAAAVIVAYLLAVYLARVPVAVWAGRFVLGKLGRPDVSQYGAFAAGIVVLYVLFALPVLGWFVWFACTFLGLGAMVLGVRDWRQSRKLAASAVTVPAPPQNDAAPPAAAPASEPPADPPGPPIEGA